MNQASKAVPIIVSPRGDDVNPYEFFLASPEQYERPYTPKFSGVMPALFVPWFYVSRIHIFSQSNFQIYTSRILHISRSLGRLGSGRLFYCLRSLIPLCWAVYLLSSVPLMVCHILNKYSKAHTVLRLDTKI